jgi:phosphoglucosamine mutase
VGKWFGTDGVRGVANRDLTPELAYQLGRVGAYVLTARQPSSRIVIGKDTRISGDLLETALISGILSMGVDAMRLGVIPTPGVAYLTKHLRADAGVMISASHNPVEDNGIKFFAGDGFKLPDHIEDEMERWMSLSVDELPRPIGAAVGRLYDEPAIGTYIDFLCNTVQHSMTGLHIVLDCANGAASEIAPALFERLGAKLTVIHAAPDGVNINVACGSTHPHVVQRAVLSTGADVGLAFDGDADRLIAVDQSGEVVDGDFILAICAKALKSRGRLVGDRVVSTVMSNLGFLKAMADEQIHVDVTSVGDRYVMERMRETSAILGGEQSGHIIFLNHTTTGDGILTALQLVEVMQDTQQPLAQLRQMMRRYPQLLENVRVSDKTAWRNNPRIQAALQSEVANLGEEGRILVRESGTEPIVRVMAEGPDELLLQACVSRLVAVVREELGVA